MRGLEMGLTRGAVLIGVLVLATASARAAEVTATINAPLKSVNVSYGTSTPAATYEITFKNIGTSATQNSRFLATTSVGGSTDSTAKAVFGTPVSPDYASCLPTTFERTAIDCYIGSLPIGGEKKFTVTVLAPTSGTSIGFAWEAIHNSGDSPGNSNGDRGVDNSVAVAPLDNNNVQTRVPLNTELQFFTGTGIASKDDPWVTRVSILGSATEALATVSENVASGAGCVPAAGLTTCNTTDLSIPGVTFGVPGSGGSLEQFLKITLLRDASTISRGAKISSAVIYYLKDTSLPWTAKQVVLSCTETVDGKALPQPGIPCEDRSQRKEYPRKNTGRTPVEPGYEGDWQFTIYATDNGRYGDM